MASVEGAVKWTENMTVKFLELFAQHPCLWDPSDANYGNKSRRKTTLDSIARSLGLTGGMRVEELKQKIHSIRNQYHNIRRRIERSKQNGETEIYQPSLSWYSLADSILGKLNTGTMKRPYSATMNIQEANVPLRCEESTPQTLHSHPSTSSSSSHDFHTSADADTQSVLSRVEDAMAELRRLSESMIQPEEDEIWAFNKSIAIQMRKLPEEYVIELMCEIQELVARKRKKFIQDSAHS